SPFYRIAAVRVLNRFREFFQLRCRPLIVAIETAGETACPTLLDQFVWRSRWSRQFRLPVEAETALRYRICAIRNETHATGETQSSGFRRRRHWLRGWRRLGRQGA